MSSGQLVLITSTLSPHDVSVLVLIALFCFDTGHLDQRMLMHLIPPPLNSGSDVLNPFEKQHTAVTKKVILPFLSDLVTFLINNEHRAVALRLISTLDAVATVDGISRLVATLDKHCLRTSYREISKTSASSSIKRQLTKASLLGSYVDRCITKHKLQDFEESEKLWRNLRFYVKQFKASNLYADVKSALPPLDPFMAFLLKSQDDNDEGDEADTGNCGPASVSDMYTNLLMIEGDALAMVSREHLQAILIEEINFMFHGTEKIRSSTREIIDCMSLEDRSRFPIVHMLKSMEQLNNQCYDSFLDLLYRYFDYVLGQNSEPHFHMSLLSLASFHAHFNDTAAAVKTFEEAISVARENKDTKTLNLILMWVFEFIMKYPSLASTFRVTTEQIINYLKSCPGNQSPNVFEMAYKFETQWIMLNSGYVPDILEALFKSSLVALQNVSQTSKLSLLSNHNAQVWEFLGSTALKQIYKRVATFSSRHLNDFEKENALKLSKHETASELLRNLESPYLSYSERRNLERLQIKHLGNIGDCDKAVRLANAKIQECKSEGLDIDGEQRLTLLKCQVMIQCGMEVRCLPLVKKVLDHAILTKNSSLTASCVFLLSRILSSLRKFDECLEMLKSTMHHVLEYLDQENHCFLLGLYRDTLAVKSA